MTTPHQHLNLWFGLHNTVLSNTPNYINTKIKQFFSQVKSVIRKPRVLITNTNTNSNWITNHNKPCWPKHVFVFKYGQTFQTSITIKNIPQKNTKHTFRIWLLIVWQFVWKYFSIIFQFIFVFFFRIEIWYILPNWIFLTGFKKNSVSICNFW